MARTYKFADLQPEYARRWAAMKIKPGKGSSLDAVARKIIAGKAEYQRVEADTGVPWAVVGVLHNREASCDFRGVLHNGEKILGTGRKTRLVPKGRGPFRTWHEAALDAIAIKGWDKSTVWSIEFFLYASEVFNGMGYRAHGVPSAYLWSFSDQYTVGKYIRDGVFDASVVDQQMGVAPLMQRLFILDPSADFTAANDDRAPPAPEPEPADVAIEPDDGLSEGEVRALQQRLRDLGYAGVGRVDGKYGPDTTGAVAAFQAAAGLPVTGKLDATTAAALTTAPAKQIGNSRATTTAATMRQRGDAVTKSTWWAKLWAAILGGPSLAVGVAQETGTASGYIATAKSLLADVPDVVWLAALVAVAAAIYLTAQRAEGAAVANVRDGRDAGPA